MIRKSILGLSLLSLSLSACTTAGVAPSQETHAIRETYSMREALESVTSKDTLLVFDIDNTLLEPVGNVGSDQWFYYLQKIYELKGVKKDQIEARATATWNRSQDFVRLQPVEKETPDLLRDRAKTGFKLLALTARNPKIADRTVQQLRSIQIDFRGHSISDQEIHISKNEIGAPEDAIFKDGVLLVGESNKGKVLVHFLKKLGYHPEGGIFFIDDKIKNTKNVEAALTENKIPSFVYRYGALDKKVNAFNEVVAEVNQVNAAKLLFLGQVEE